MARPTLLLGTASFGMDMTNFQSSGEVKEMLKTLKKLGVSNLDTAARYPPLNPGRSEQLLGEAAELTHTFTIDTKVATGQGDGSGSLTKEAIEKSVKASFDKLKLRKVRILYAHAPDKVTPLRETATAFDEQIRIGHCDAWGVSNYSPGLLCQLLDVCEENGIRKPGYYQGDYNIITRGMETQLLPILRRHSMNYVAFRPVAAGFLTGKLIFGNAEGTRLASDNPLGSRIANGVFGSQLLRQATGDFIKKVEGMDMAPLEVALRWIYWHSPLGEGDGVILGASKVTQVEQNMASIERGPLDARVLKAVEDVWEELEEERSNVL